LLAVIVPFVLGHGRLSQPSPRGFFLTPPKANFLEEAPVSGGLGQDFICRNDPAPTPDKFVSVQAGALTNFQWFTPAAHVGDCFLYITYDADKPDAEKLWFKIAELPDCKSQTGQIVPVTIPNYLASCEHCIIRWEWYALHLYPGNVEFYAQCFDAKIVADPAFQAPALGAPRYVIPGHLPVDNIAQNYRDPFSGTNGNFLTGPPLATYDASSTSLVPGGAQQQGAPGSVNVAAAVILPILAVIIVLGVVGVVYLKIKRPEVLSAAKTKAGSAVDAVKSKFGK
jgi:hypothetical protein